MLDKKLLLDILEAKKFDKRINIERGCKAAEFGGCFCTGECKKIIGYWENGVYTNLNNNVLIQNNGR